MNKDILKGKWEQIKGTLQKQWGKLTDDELSQIKGDTTKLKGYLQEKYGYTKEAAEQKYKEVFESKSFLDRFKDDKEGFFGEKLSDKELFEKRNKEIATYKEKERFEDRYFPRQDEEVEFETDIDQDIYVDGDIPVEINLDRDYDKNIVTEHEINSKYEEIKNQRQDDLVRESVVDSEVEGQDIYVENPKTVDTADAELDDDLIVEGEDKFQDEAEKQDEKPIYIEEAEAKEYIDEANIIK